LVRTVEDEMRARLAQSFSGSADEALNAALISPHVEIAYPILAAAGPLEDPDLVSSILGRVEEHRFHTAAGRGRDAAGGLLLELVHDADEVLAREAMALLIAQSRRFDRFSDPVLTRTDLTSGVQQRLVWAVAAALRTYMISQHCIAPAVADKAIVSAAGEIAAGYDEAQTLESCCIRVAKRLNEAGRLSDEMLGRSLRDVGLPFFLAGLAIRTRLDPFSAREIVHAAQGAALLLRAGEVVRAEAAIILLQLKSLSHSGDTSAQIDLFDQMSPAQARETLLLWQVHPSYRSVIGRLS
jgi:uncharacterized protein (DUF2336 family)